jgi:hypothetical protein
MNNTLEILIERLNGPNYRDYVDLLVSNISPKLENWEELCWYPNNDETINMIIEHYSYSIRETIESFSDARYDINADFIHPLELTTIYYSDLRDIYINEFMALESYTLEFFLEVLSDIEDELLEMD